MTQTIACFTPNAIKAAVAQSAAALGLGSKHLAILFDGIDAATPSFMMMGNNISEDKQPEDRRSSNAHPHSSRLCRRFYRHGHCKYGKDCFYAHSHDAAVNTGSPKTTDEESGSSASAATASDGITTSIEDNAEKKRNVQSKVELPTEVDDYHMGDGIDAMTQTKNDKHDDSERWSQLVHRAVLVSRQKLSKYDWANIDARRVIEETELKGEWLQLTDLVRHGDVVQASVAFLSIDVVPVAITPASVGVVEHVDDDGDALIRFPDRIDLRNRSRWVKKQQLKSMMRRSESV